MKLVARIATTNVLVKPVNQYVQDLKITSLTKKNTCKITKTRVAQHVSFLDHSIQLDNLKNKEVLQNTAYYIASNVFIKYKNRSE